MTRTPGQRAEDHLVAEAHKQGTEDGVYAAVQLVREMARGATPGPAAVLAAAAELLEQSPAFPRGEALARCEECWGQAVDAAAAERGGVQ